MDRAVRFSLFALGTFIGALFVTLAVQWTSESADEPVLAQGGQALESLAGLNARMATELALRGALKLNPTTGDEPDPNDFEAIEARNRELAERRAKLIDELAAREAVDPSWAPDMQRQMIEQFAARAPKGAKLLSATCKTSLCIAEVESLSRRDSTGQTGWSGMFGLRRGFVMNVESPIEGQYRSFVYLARDGHSLPK